MKGGWLVYILPCLCLHRKLEFTPLSRLLCLLRASKDVPSTEREQRDNRYVYYTTSIVQSKTLIDRPPMREGERTIPAEEPLLFPVKIRISSTPQTDEPITAH
jgi:hypothetical protein